VKNPFSMVKKTILEIAQPVATFLSVMAHKKINQK